MKYLYVCCILCCAYKMDGTPQCYLLGIIMRDDDELELDCVVCCVV